LFDVYLVPYGNIFKSDNVPGQSTAGISGTCGLGTKADIRVMFAVFYSSNETVYLRTSGKAVLYPL
jgi:hypothetical protein